MDRNAAVTGAFGFTGKYITRRLLDSGYRVMTLTDSTARDNPFQGAVAASPFHFDEPARLRAALKGVRVLFNTYWIRFDTSRFTLNDAVKNSLILLEAARAAGVERIVHVSITNASLDSDLTYFRGKAVVERALKQTGMSWCILRPAVLFGTEDILINNIAWALRRFPVFGVFGKGDYRLQPIHVDDLAALAVHNARNDVNTTINAIGPETFTYRQMVETIAGSIGRHRPIVSVHPVLGHWAGRVIGWAVGDIFVSREEIQGLMAERLYVYARPAGRTQLTRWAAKNAATLGRNYASEMARRLNRKKAYRDL